MSGHMRLPPHVSSQAPLRPGRSALRFSQTGLRQSRSCSALALLAPSRLEVRSMPFRSKGAGGPDGPPRRASRPRREGAARGHRPRRRARRRRAGPPTRARSAGRIPHGRHDDPGAATPRWPAQDGPRRKRRRLPPADVRAAHDAARRGRASWQAGSREAGSMIVKKVPTSKRAPAKSKAPQRARSRRLHRRPERRRRR